MKHYCPNLKKRMKKEELPCQKYPEKYCQMNKWCKTLYSVGG